MCVDTVRGTVLRNLRKPWKREGAAHSLLCWCGASLVSDACPAVS